MLQLEKFKGRGASSYEKELCLQGYRNICGVDEVGRGAITGPVVAAAVILDPDKPQIYGIRDSKVLTRGQREELHHKICERAIAVGVGQASAREIEELNVGKASLLAMRRAVESLSVKPDYVLIDYFEIPDLPFPQQGITKGDEKVLCISAASIVAKHRRDALLKCWGYIFPGYGWTSNAGYYSPEHRRGATLLGTHPEHRKTFAFVKWFGKLYSGGEVFEKDTRDGFRPSEWNKSYGKVVKSIGKEI
jgi:ribonuclease HII